MSDDRVEQLSIGMAENRPALAIVLSDVLPEAFGEGLRERLAAPDLPVTVERMRMGPFAGLEVYLPSAVMLFVAAGYFNGFLQKLGEDHYGAVKDVAKTLLRRASTSRVTPIASRGKLLSGFSLAYSITGELVPGVSLKLVLRTEVDEANGERGVAAFLDLIRNIHLGQVGEQEIKSLLAHRPIGGVIVVTFDATTGTIVPVPPPHAMKN